MYIMHMYIYIYIYIHTHMCIYIYIKCLGLGSGVPTRSGPQAGRWLENQPWLMTHDN